MNRITVGNKVKVTCLDGEIYTGILSEICIGVDPEQPVQASIIIEEEITKERELLYGQIHIWCNGLKNIETL